MIEFKKINIFQSCHFILLKRFSLVSCPKFLIGSFVFQFLVYSGHQSSVRYTVSKDIFPILYANSLQKWWCLFLLVSRITTFQFLVLMPILLRVKILFRNVLPVLLNLSTFLIPSSKWFRISRYVTFSQSSPWSWPIILLFTAMLILLVVPSPRLISVA